MADDRLPSSSGKPTVISAVGSWLLIIPSAIVGLLLVELFCRLFLPSVESPQGLIRAFERVLFFDGPGTIFKNRGELFTFIPNSEIRNLTAIFSDKGFTVEYDYHFRTNNFGLVQDADVVPDRDSFLLLGDSFTQGLGAEPWFRLVSPEIDKLGYQPVNGGLMGTGFEQWLRLERYLTANNFRIHKLVVPFISADYMRPVWNLAPDDFRCLSTLTLCRLGESYFYRLPPREELSSWIAKIKASRASKGSRPPTTRRGWLAAQAVALLPATHRVYKYFHLALVERQSDTAITELIRVNGAENVMFIHLPQKDEIENGISDLGLKARRAIRGAGGKLSDGFKLCGLTPEDYYVNDDHPNSGGYAKIAACVGKIINEM